MKVDARKVLGWASLLTAAGVILHELRWTTRSGLAWVLIVLAAAIGLLALAHVLPETGGRGKPD